jgi:hyperosmotically inducible protein
MRTTRILLSVVALFAIGTVVGCKEMSSKSPDVSDAIRKSLDQAGLKDVTIHQDRDKGIVTLGGEVANADEKVQAETLAKSLAGAQVVADEIAVIPAGQSKDVIAVNSDLDEAIEKNLDASLIQNKMQHDVNYAVKNGVVTLSGEVSRDDVRVGAEKLATAVPNVHQVVNDIQVVKNRKASSGQ